MLIPVAAAISTSDISFRSELWMVDGDGDGHGGSEWPTMNRFTYRRFCFGIIADPSLRSLRMDARW